MNKFPIIPQDKANHFIVGALIGTSALLIGGYASIPVLAAAIGKEVYDHFHGGSVELYDTIATTLGGVLSVGLVILARLF